MMGMIRCCSMCIVIPVMLAIVLELLITIWFMNQRQGLLLVPQQSDDFVGTTTATRLSSSTEQRRTTIGTYNVLERIPHDTTAFTQGLVLVGFPGTNISNNSSMSTIQNYLLEGTGLYKVSQLRQINISTGVVLSSHSIPIQCFGEGIAHYRSLNELHVLQLTWKNRIAFDYALLEDDVDYHNPKHSTTPSSTSLFNDFNNRWNINTWKVNTSTKEGWGITYSYKDNVLYISDGSELLHVYDVATKQLIRTITVRYRHHVKQQQYTIITMINELEYEPITNTIYANVWKEDIILRIDPYTGFVISMYDLTPLKLLSTQTISSSTQYQRKLKWWSSMSLWMWIWLRSTFFYHQQDVLNGIALTYDPSITPSISSSFSNIAVHHPNSIDNPLHHKYKNEVWVTGKHWPYMYRIQLLDVLDR